MALRVTEIHMPAMGDDTGAAMTLADACLSRRNEPLPQPSMLVWTYAIYPES